MTDQDRARRALEGLDLVDPQIDFSDEFGHRVVIRVISPSFEHIDEYERQLMDREKLMEEFGEDEAWVKVEAVFTDSPSEIEAYLAEAKAANENKP